MTKTCGDFGGVLASGRPCGRKAAWGRSGATEGRCRNHTEEGEARLQEQKKAFVAEVAKGTVSMKAAADAVGRDQATVWRWRQADPGFDRAVKEAHEAADGVRVGMVEDSLFARIATGKATAAETIFFLCNRAPERWRHVQRIEHTGADAGPIEYHVEGDTARERLADLISGIATRREAKPDPQELN